MAKYRKRPVVIEAIQWTGRNLDECLAFVAALPDPESIMPMMRLDDQETLAIWNTKEGQWIRCPVGHWVIRGVAGEHYPCAPDVFAATYDPVESA